METQISAVKDHTKLWNQDLSELLNNSFASQNEALKVWEKNHQNQTRTIILMTQLNSILMNEIRDLLENVSTTQKSAQFSREEEHDLILLELQELQNVTQTFAETTAIDLISIRKNMDHGHDELENLILKECMKMLNKTKEIMESDHLDLRNILSRNFNLTDNFLTQFAHNSSESDQEIDNQLIQLHQSIAAVGNLVREVVLDLSEIHSNISEKIEQERDHIVNVSQALSSDVKRQVTDIVDEGKKHYQSDIIVVMEKLDVLLSSTFTNISFLSTNINNLQTTVHENVLEIKNISQLIVDSSSTFSSSLNETFKYIIEDMESTTSVIAQMINSHFSSLTSLTQESKEFHAMILKNINVNHHSIMDESAAIQVQLNQTSDALIEILGDMAIESRQNYENATLTCFNVFSPILSSLNSKHEVQSQHLNQSVQALEKLQNDTSAAFVSHGDRLDTLKRFIDEVAQMTYNNLSMTHHIHLSEILDNSSSLMTSWLGNVSELMAEKHELAQKAHEKHNDELLQLMNFTALLKNDLEMYHENSLLTTGAILDWNITELLTHLLLESRQLIGLERTSLQKQEVLAENISVKLNEIHGGIHENVNLINFNSALLNESIIAAVNQTKNSLTLDLMKNQQLLTIQVRN